MSDLVNNSKGFTLLTARRKRFSAGPVATWQSTFNNRDYFTVRHVYQGKNDGPNDWRASSSGVTVPLDQAETLLTALNEAYKPKPKRNGKLAAQVVADSAGG